MEHVITTGLNISQSRRAVDLAMAEYGKKFAQYKPTLNWSSETDGEFGFSASGMTIQGKASLAEGQLKVKFDNLPFLARMFMPTALKTVNEEVQLWVKKVAAGE